VHYRKNNTSVCPLKARTFDKETEAILIYNSLQSCNLSQMYEVEIGTPTAHFSKQEQLNATYNNQYPTFVKERTSISSMP
jgi:hypothetical protein